MTPVTSTGEKGGMMSNRVLNRRGARDVTPEELEQIVAAGGPNHTLVCTAVPSLNGAILGGCDVES